MIEGLPGLIAIGIVATVGFLMARPLNARRGRSGSADDGGSGYWSGGDITGPSAASSLCEGADRSESSGRFGGLFGSSDSSSSSDSSDGGGGDGGGGD